MSGQGRRSGGGRGQGNGGGQGRGSGQRDGQGFGRVQGLGGGRGKNNGGSFGTGGFCVCAKCGEKIAHKQGVKCTGLKCPACGHVMIREELLNS